jgi:hypothetical protein
LHDSIQSAFLLEKEATIAEVTAAECLEHQKIPSSFLKDELHIAQITTPQIHWCYQREGSLHLAQQLPGNNG